jgi:hypothetical protein
MRASRAYIVIGTDESLHESGHKNKTYGRGSRGG